MPSRNIFIHNHSALNPFLYADIGAQDAAGTLTIASLFGRGGYDPWEEAARLARLPVASAVASLATMIAGVPSNSRSLPEATAIAERLVALLPGPAASERLSRAHGVLRRPSSLRLPGGLPIGWLATCALGLGVAVVLVFAWLWVVDVSGAGGRNPAAPTMLDPIARDAAP